MSQHPYIRRDSILIIRPFNSPKHPPLRCGSQHAMIWKVYPAEEVDAGGEGLDEDFVGMQIEVDPQSQEVLDTRK